MPCVSVILTNTRSVTSKRESLNSVINTVSADIVALTETWLHTHIHDSEIFDVSCFNIYRCDRTLRQGGGVLLAVKKSYPSHLIHVHTDLESVWSCVDIGHRKFVMGVCYRPPSYPPTFVSELHDALNIVSTRHPTAPIFLMGDFNFPHISWSSETPASKPPSSQTTEFLNLCSLFSFSQLVSEPTRTTQETANILDLILTTHANFASPISYLPGLSDHSLLSFNINVPLSKATTSTKQIRDYSRADFETINNELACFLDIFLLHFDTRTVQENWNLFKNKVHELTDKYIPLRTINSNPEAPWYNKQLNRLSNRKKRCYRLAKKSPSDYRWNAYTTANKAYIAAVKLAKSHFLQRTLPSMLINDPKKFWRVITPSKTNSITLTGPDGSIIPSSECSSLLNAVFCQNFVVSSNPSIPELQNCNYLSMDPIVTDPGGVSKIIQSLKPSSSPGVDLINTKFLKSTVVYSSIILCKIFQQTLDTSILPADWEVGKVVPLHKSGNKHTPNNFRPISLTSIPCKILEHVIFSHLVKFLEFNSFFSPTQHGFRKKFSCETQLLSLTHKLHLILDRRSSADCIFLDFSKAFDKVSHKLLLYKLSKLNLDPKLFAWIEYFLSNRFQFVTANNYDSSPSSVHSGVPQGSVLGPLLFLIYVNDLPSCVLSNIHLFADDCVIFREINNDNDVTALQSDINAISNWCEQWLMELNTTKCKVLRISRTALSTGSYYLNNTLLEPVTSYRYLGIHITTDLTWSLHINTVINNANRLLGYLRRNFFSAPTSLKTLLYKSLVRSKLEYASSIWDPSHDYLVTSLELVQNNAARFILGNFTRAASVTSMKNLLQLPTLTSRRKHSRLCLFHKIYYHNSPLFSELITPPSYISSRMDHRHKVGTIPCNTNAFFQSFIPRTSQDWNRLPGLTAAIEDNHQFRAALANIV